MKIFPTRLTAILLAAVLSACTAQAPQPDTVADIAAIEELYGKWRTAVETGNIAGYAASLDDEIVMIPPGGQNVVGIARYREFLVPVFEMASYEITPVGPFDIEIMGDVALISYEYVIRLTLKNQDAAPAAGALTAQVNASKYFDVARRQAGGGWKVYRHTWNASPPSAM